MSSKKSTLETTSPRKKPFVDEKQNQHPSITPRNLSSIPLKGANSAAANKIFSPASAFYDRFYDEDLDSEFDADPLSESDSEEDAVESPTVQPQTVEYEEHISEENASRHSGSDSSCQFETSDAPNYDEYSSTYEDQVPSRSQECATSNEEEDLEVDIDVICSDVEASSLPLCDGSGDSHGLAIIDIFNDDDAEWNSLANSQTSGELVSFEMNDYSDSIKCVNSDDLDLKRALPGVYASAFHKFKNVSVGYLKLSPKTIKPFERAADVSIVYTVFRGQVILKSSAFEVIDDVKVLQKTVCEVGTTLTVPIGHPHALENRSDCDALLQYVVIQ